MFGRGIIGLIGGLVVIALNTGAWALQAGGVEVGDLETGSVVGQPFKELPVDFEVYATEVGNLKILYPPTSVLDLKVRPGTPVLIKVTNKSSVERGFLMTADTAQAAPTVLRAQLVLKPGESKYVGVPLSDLLYATAGNTLTYRDHLDPKSVSGKLVLIK
jgi:hypothetical protein